MAPKMTHRVVDATAWTMLLIPQRTTGYSNTLM